jgi:hypothetical protein
MSRRDDSQWARPPSQGGGGPGDGDVMDHGGPSRGPGFITVLAAGTLVLGLAVGYAVGRNQAPAAVPAARASTAHTQMPPPDFGAQDLSQSGQQCSTQIGRRLQLGVQVTNQSRSSVTLSGVRVVEPLGGLKETAHAWGTCGQLSAVASPSVDLLGAGDSTWFTVTFRVLERCPGALPVQFLLRYDSGGQTQTARLPGFVDLGHVPYSGCPVA